MTEQTPEYVYEDMSDAADEAAAPAHAVTSNHHEAPAVIFTQLYTPKGGQVVQFNLTIRADSGPQAIDGMIEAINYAKKRGLSVIRPTGVMAPESPAAAPTPQNNVNAHPAAQNAPAAPVAAPAGNAAVIPGAKTVIATKMTVMPKPDGKVTLEWFADGHKYADIYTTRAVDSALTLLASTGAWTKEHLTAAQTFQVHHLITWRDSDKLNSKGNPYKDLVSIANV